MKVMIVIPAYNEEKSICRVVDRLIEEYPEYDYIIVNDGSHDKTAQICKAKGYRLIDLPVNLGLSGAFQTGLQYAWTKGYDGVLQFDADGQHKPEYIAEMIQVMKEEAVDIVIGSRFVTVKKPKNLRMLGSYLIAFSMWITTGAKICDPTSGMRLFNSKMMEAFAYDANYSPEPDTISYLLRNGARVKEVQVVMGEREEGESYLNPLNSIKYMIKMGISIIFIQWFRERKRVEKEQ